MDMMSLFDTIWGHDDPQAAANQYLDKIPGMGREYLNPYIERGNQAGNQVSGEYDKLLNPNNFMDEIMKHFSESPGAQYQREQLGKGIGATAAAGGYAGNPEHQRQYGEMSNKIMSGDMQQYLQNALGIYGKGLSGKEDIFNKGFGATNSLVDLLGGTLSSQGGLAFKSASDRNAERQALMSAIMKAAGGAAGAGGF